MAIHDEVSAHDEDHSFTDVPKARTVASDITVRHQLDIRIATARKHLRQLEDLKAHLPAVYLDSPADDELALRRYA